MSETRESDMAKNPNGILKYAEFLGELLAAQGKEKSELARKLGVREGRIYDFFEGKHCPSAALAKAVEYELGVNLPAEYYGWGEVIKP
jgi:ribosome-binding protein aMBF1 (putative translation factor)